MMFPGWSYYYEAQYFPRFNNVTIKRNIFFFNNRDKEKLMFFCVTLLVNSV